jgi:lipoyl synthase
MRAAGHARPQWLRATVPAEAQEHLERMRKILTAHGLHSVCQSARCPNMAACFSQSTVTFLIMGEVCTRNCLFCAVEKGAPRELDPREALHIADAVAALELRHVVITSVTRDDLDDGGACHFAGVVRQIRDRCPGTAIELLIPDLQGSREALKRIIASGPDIIGHNIETVRRLFGEIRPAASFGRSIEVLRLVKEMTASIVSKSGFMVGLGETEEEVVELLSLLRGAGCDMVAIGQYLRPSVRQTPTVEYIPPSLFLRYREKALQMGFQAASAGPLVRSSYNAGALLEQMKSHATHS